MDDRDIEVLLIEDDAGDADLVRECLQDIAANVSLNVVDDGVKALAYLRREESYADAVRPDLILLDLNLPRKDGREVLREIKQDRVLKHIPVVVLTTSDYDRDVIESYGLGANCYVTKPESLDQFWQAVRAIETFWCTVARLPPE